MGEAERLAVNRRNEAWMALGDFNEILGNHEKSGGRIRSEASFTEFRAMMRNCAFTDLPTVGNRFSWAGKRGNEVVQCCLDRVMANPSWCSEFPVSETVFLEFGESDHRPLVAMIVDALKRMVFKLRYIEDGRELASQVSYTYLLHNESVDVVNIYLFGSVVTEQMRRKEFKYCVESWILFWSLIL